MPNCPVCNTEYQQQQVNFCLKCGWYLGLSSTSGDEVLEDSGLSSSEALQKAEKWAIRKWQSSLRKPPNLEPLAHTEEQESQLQQLRAEYEELQTKFSQSQQERSRLKSELDDYTEKYNQLQAEYQETQQERSPPEIVEKLNNLTEQVVAGNKEQDIQKSQLSKIETNLQNILEKLPKKIEPMENSESKLPEIVEKLNEQVAVGNQELMHLKSQLSIIETNLQKLSGKLSQQSNQNEILEKIYQQISSLTERLEKIEQPSYPEEVSPPLSLADINLSWQEAELAATYNANPNSLLETETAITVSDSQSTQEIVLEIDKRGNYYIISQGSDNYLVPKQQIKLNKHNQKTFDQLFEGHGLQEKFNTLLLLKPAKVSPINPGQSWRLSERGVVKWIQIEVASLDTPTPTPEPIPETKEELTPEPTPEPTPETAPEPQVILPPLSPEEANLVEFYNGYHSWRSKRPTTVSKVNDSSDTVVLEKSKWGRYWILSEESGDYLAPRQKANINPDNNEDVQGLFECYGDSSGELKQFQLLKLAKVEPTGDRGKWKVLELGVLKFESRKLKDEDNSENENQTKES